jgi:predicted lipoprotein with Yx(FWY)xxD motif
MRHLLKVSLPAIAVSLLIAACGSSSQSKTNAAASVQAAGQTSSAPAGAAIKTASNSTLGTILVDGQGMTLYHLSGEQNGKFICTSSACVGVWHPVAAVAGASGGEVGSLGSVKRPDGTMQATYKGTPLYTFAEDEQPGEANGQGIKDVGTWSAVTTSSSASTSAASTTAPAAPATTTAAPESAAPESSGSGYGY